MLSDPQTTAISTAIPDPLEQVAARLQPAARPCEGCPAGVWLRLGGVWVHHTAVDGSLQRTAVVNGCYIRSEVRSW